MALKVLQALAARVDPLLVTPAFTFDAIDIIIATYREQKITADTSFTLLALFTNLPPLEATLVQAVCSVFSTTSTSPRTSAMPPHSRGGQRVHFRGSGHLCRTSSGHDKDTYSTGATMAASRDSDRGIG